MGIKISMEFLIRFAQSHESFRRAELEALALIEKLDLEILEYNPDVRLSSHYLLVLDHIS